MNYSIQALPKPAISAESIRIRLCTSQRGTSLHLRDQRIKGRLDLRNCTINGAIDVRNCVFMDGIDGRDATFCQTVRFVACRFEGDVSFGELNDSHAVFKQDLICTATVFTGDVQFFGSRIAGSANFDDCRLTSRRHVFGFSNTRIEKTFSCAHAVIDGSAAFNGMRCGTMAGFKGTVFGNRKGLVDFVGSEFGKTLECIGTIFKGGLDLSGASCRLAARFYDARFENTDVTVVFAHARFGSMLDCRRTVFFGGANFAGIKCKHVSFANALFNSSRFSCYFSHVEIGWWIDMQKAVFMGPVSFDGMRCGGDARFQDTVFHGDKPVEIKFAQVGVSAYFTHAVFNPGVTFDSTRIERALVLNKVHINCRFSLRNIIIGHLGIEDFVVDQDTRTDLTGVTFQSFDGRPHDVARLCGAQTSELISRDPYLQFEHCYQSSGDEEKATAIYYAGRRSMTRAAWQRDSAVNWGLSTRLWDLVVWMITGYGARTTRVTLLVAVFIVLGTAIFWNDEALRTKSEAVATNETHVQRPEGWPNHLVDRLGFSVDLFLPVLNLEIAENSKINGVGREVYGLIHVLVGWLLVPLLIASLSGLVRSH